MGSVFSYMDKKKQKFDYISDQTSEPCVACFDNTRLKFNTHQVLCVLNFLFGVTLSARWSTIDTDEASKNIHLVRIGITCHFRDVPMT